jgi:hypothetical protein
MQTEQDAPPTTGGRRRVVTVVVVAVAAATTILAVMFAGSNGARVPGTFPAEPPPTEAAPTPGPGTGTGPSPMTSPSPLPGHGVEVDASTTGPTAYYAPDLGRTLTYDDLEPSGSIVTEADGQVIERLDVNGDIRIVHDDVTIRAVRVRGGGRYSISAAGDAAPSGTTIEYVEIDGGGNPDQIGIYLDRFTLRASHVHGQSTGVRFGRESTLEANYVHSQALSDGSHNTAMSIHGGFDVVVRANNLEGSTSAALSLYPRVAPLRDILVEDNLFNGGSYCVYAGYTANHPHRDENRGIRFIGNRFGEAFEEACGSYGPVHAFNPDQPGNEWRDNTWERTGEPVP